MIGRRSKQYEMDMCSGSLAGKILLFSLPLMLSSLLQLLFNAADVIVVGRYAAMPTQACGALPAALWTRPRWSSPPSCGGPWWKIL